MRKKAGAVWSIGLAALAGVAVCLALYLGGFRLLRITSASMGPGIEVGTYVVAREGAIRASSFTRGDIAVFRYPFGSDLRAIKRVVALPGDIVEVHAHEVIVNGQRTQAAPATNSSKAHDDVDRFAIAPGTVFLLGDNAAASIDSRDFGPVAEREILGAVILVLP